jgi:hypothetical protein
VANPNRRLPLSPPALRLVVLAWALALVSGIAYPEVRDPQQAVGSISEFGEPQIAVNWGVIM